MPLARVNSSGLEGLIYREGGVDSFNKAHLLARKAASTRRRCRLGRQGFPKMNWFVVTNNLSPTPTTFEVGARM